MLRCLVLFLLCVLASCSSSRPLKKDKASGLPVARRLHQLDSVDEGMLRGRRGAMFRVSAAVDAAPEEEMAVVDNCQSGAKDCSSSLFLGCDRKAAKLSYSNKPMPAAEPLQHLVDRLLNTENTMMNHMPAISLASTSTRVTEETENVYLNHVFIYVIIREGDGDYHLIVGDGTHTAGETLMNVEISGLPDASSSFYTKLKSVRDKFENKYKMCSVKNFWEAHLQLPEISVKGSLFFDLLHAKGGKHAGNNTIKTKTFWEIHPATYIKFWN